MKRYLVERRMPGIGKASVNDIRSGARASNAALDALAPDIQWIESYIGGDKTYCVYLAKDEAAIRKHAKMTGSPISKISEIHRIIDPTTGRKI